MTTLCENCGSSEKDEDLSPVHRVYLEVDESGRVTGEKVLAPVERWCRSCRSLYPHRQVDDAERGGGTSPGSS